ncbi:sugar isomerase domain-containing protein [Jeotgalibacillus sp. S-D1]|uniref:sugar isomerase domain-containing protein n=1 Tax=Jeotgalibacillus sp. S-D1 TaxID=2552189 RepID=UPI001059F2D9|nr:SIS domain-containing protein [Jeotgalibacillus sp. S-D1]TDL31041.1 sugar isomerase domain-containing protein [Jeotgalibacillus sp. S-D1]
MSDYLARIQELLQEAYSTEKMAIERIAAVMTDRLAKGGIVQLFGCGHSNLIAQEPFYRAGGLVPVMPINSEPIMLHNGAVQASVNEKDTDVSKEIVKNLTFGKYDTLIVISNSGRNPAPIEVARAASTSGIYTVGILSRNYTADSHPSRHHSGLRLEEVVDDSLNNHSPVGDGILTTNSHQLYGSSSSILGIALLNAVLTQVIRLTEKQGIEPPVFKSGNDDDSQEHNEKLVQRYSDRIQF